MEEIEKIEKLIKENINDEQIRKEIFKYLTVIHCRACDWENKSIREEEYSNTVRRKMELAEKENDRFKRAIAGLIGLEYDC